MKKNENLLNDKPHEECGVYGIYGTPQAAHYAYLGLYSLQHRGQESAGIMSSDGHRLYRYASMGQVARVFSKNELDGLQGYAAIGHNRYSTTGASFLRNAQPIRVASRLGGFGLAHNGNLINSFELKTQLEKEGSIFQTTVDTEIIVHLMSRSSETNFTRALVWALEKVQGAYSLLVLTKKTLYAVRDPNGFRPFCLGIRKDGAYVVASETSAFDITETKYLREVEPGELISIDENGLQSIFPFAKVKNSMCIFEKIYFSRPDSMVFGGSVYNVRKNLGKYLAKEHHINADLVVPVPDSSNVAALGYAEESKIPFAMGLIRSHYVGRTFIEPDQKIRDFGARIKYNVVKSILENKRIVLVDDSIMRGTTAIKLVKMLREAGVKEIHLRISAPPTLHPCYYGVDIPTQKELIAANVAPSELAKYLGADSVEYISLEKTILATHEENNPATFNRSWCTACFTGNYPLGVNNSHIEKEIELFTDLDDGNYN